jgi:hypothetical protein
MRISFNILNSKKSFNKSETFLFFIRIKNNKYYALMEVPAMLWIFRIVLFLLIIYLFYRCFKFIVNPKRKLELAQEQKKFYFFDDQDNVRKNFFITYKGVLFEGEKYLGTTEDSFEVVSIFVWTNNVSSLKGLSLKDFYYIEGEIRERYPKAKIDWKSPIKELLNNNDNETS